MKYLIRVTLLLWLSSLGNAANEKCLVNKGLNGKPHGFDNTTKQEIPAQCKYWSDLSCCDTTIQFVDVNTDWASFRYHHCGLVSQQCYDMMTQELCLSECDPYLKKWIVPVKKNEKERFYKIPLCKSDCDQWFSACKSDYTCRDNWYNGFKWILSNATDDGSNKSSSTHKTNVCPDGASCDTIARVFETAENFCSRIFDDRFEVTNDVPRCVHFLFTDNETVVTTNKKLYDYILWQNVGRFSKCRKQIYI